MSLPPITGTPQFVYFGDSLSDNGNLYALTDGLLDPLVRDAISGEGGRASNGPTFAEQVAGPLGLPTALNYAIAGAEAAGSQTLLDFAEDFEVLDGLLVPQTDPALQYDINLGAQVDRFATDIVGQDVSQLSAFVLAGGNDYLEFTAQVSASDPLGAIDLAIDTLVASVTATITEAFEIGQLGVGEVIVSALPNPGFLPSISGLGGLAEALAQEVFEVHNSFLEQGVTILQNNGINARFFDLTQITSAVSDDPTQFGLLAPYEQTLREGDPAILADFDESQVAFWDSVHPTTATHGVIAAFNAAFFDGTTEITTLSFSNDRERLTAADDLVLTYAGNDAVASDAGDDTAFLGRGNDSIDAGAGADIVSAGAGDDRVFGNDGNDLILAGDDDDAVLGGLGDDFIFDGRGEDLIAGAEGNDSFIHIIDPLLGSNDDGLIDIFDGGTGTDTLYIVVTAGDEGSYSTDAAGLAALGLQVIDVESVQIIGGLDAIGGLVAGQVWADDADLWNLV